MTIRQVLGSGTLVILFLLAATAGPAEAISEACLPGGFPDTPTPPVFAANARFTTSDEFRVDVWRVLCQDGSGEVALLVRVTAITANPFVCSVNFNFVQGGQHIDGRILPGPGLPSFCADLTQATTFSLERVLGPPFDNKAAFTLIIDSSTSLAPDTTLEIPAYVPAAPTITVVSTGCNPCSAGQLAQFQIHVVNAGPPVTVELKTGVRLPGGSAITLLGVHVEDLLDPGDYTIPLAGIVVPADIPDGTYTIEAAILDPIFGVTLSRSSVSVVKQ